MLRKWIFSLLKTRLILTRLNPLVVRMLCNIAHSFLFRILFLIFSCLNYFLSCIKQNKLPKGNKIYLQLQRIEIPTVLNSNYIGYFVGAVVYKMQVKNYGTKKKTNALPWDDEPGKFTCFSFRYTRMNTFVLQTPIQSLLEVKQNKLILRMNIFVVK